MGVNENFLDNSGLELQEGRNFNLFDIQNNNMVCVLGSDFTKNLFKNIDPVGKTINIRGNRFKVIGILEEKGSTFGNNQDLKVLIPVHLGGASCDMKELSLLSQKYNFSHIGQESSLPTISITIDDGYKDSLDAIEVLVEKNIPFSIYISTGFIN